jgi:predicted MFS family arabinose efflux permease
MTSETVDQNVKGFKVWFLGFLTINMVWVGIMPVLVPTYILEKTGSAAEVGVMMAIMALGALAVPMFTGSAEKYRSYRQIQLIAFVLMAAGFFLIGITERPLLFGLAALMTGAGMGGAHVFYTVYVVGGRYSKEAEALGLGWLNRTMVIGQFVGAALISGMLFVKLSFQLMFTITAGIVIIGLLIASVTTKSLAERVIEVSDQIANEKTKMDEKPSRHHWHETLFSKFGLVLLAVFLTHAGWQALNGQYSNYFKGAFGIEPQLAASTNSIAALLTLAVIGVYAAWLAKSGPLSLFNFMSIGRTLGAFVLVALAFILGSNANTFMIIPLVVYLLMSLLRPLHDLSSASLAARTSPGGAAQAQGIMIVSISLAIAVGNLIGGEVAQNLGWMWVPAITAAMCGSAFLIGLYGRRYRPKPVPDEEKAAALSKSLSH